MSGLLASAAPFAYLPYQGGVRVLDLARDFNASVWDIPMPGAGPAGLAFAPDGKRAYFGDVFSDLVYVVDTYNYGITARVRVPSGPAALAVSPSGTRLVVGSAGTLFLAGSTLSLIDTASNSVVASAQSGLRPAAATFSADGTRIYVSNAESHTVTVHDAQTLETLVSIPVAPGPLGLALHPSGKRLYVGHIGTLTERASTVSVVDLDANAVAASISVGTRPALVVLDAANSRLYVGNVESDSISVVDTASHSVVATIPVQQSPTGLDLSADGKQLYVPTHGAGVRVVDIATGRTVSSTWPGKTIVLGRFIAPQPAPSGANTPSWLSGLWWNPSQSGWASASPTAEAPSSPRGTPTTQRERRSGTSLRTAGSATTGAVARSTK
jgi:YVTN family beta-propeller protein